MFGLLVFFHEFGHFITAKLVGMRVDEFAIGFGPKLFSKKHGETLYSLRVIPLGGFNKIAGMDPDDEQDVDSFNAKPIWQRIVVIIAGSFMNFILPIILFFIVFVTSGIDKPAPQPYIGTVIAEKPAAAAGLQSGDLVVKINETPINNWQQFVAIIQKNPGNKLLVTVKRDMKLQSLQITPEFDKEAGRGIIGVIPRIINYKPGVFEAIGLSIKQTYSITVNMIVGLIQMITGRIAAEVAGPIGVAQMAGQVAQLGLIPLLQFAAFLSINLGLINLLPVPVLDGGHVVTLAVEAVRGKPLSREKIQFIQMIGFTLLILLMLAATFKDIIRLNLF